MSQLQVGFALSLRDCHNIACYFLCLRGRLLRYCPRLRQLTHFGLDARKHDAPVNYQLAVSV